MARFQFVSHSGGPKTLTREEKLYFALYDGLAAWGSLVAVIPFLLVIGWVSAVAIVAADVL